MGGPWVGPTKGRLFRGPLALRPTHPKKILTQNLAEGKSRFPSPVINKA